MELRVLEYFLSVAREQSISRAAEALHLSQPTLSTQLKNMEEKLGRQLMIRGARKITLTEEGAILRKRAEEILDLVRKTENELAQADQAGVSGDVYIGAGETDGIRLLARAAHRLQADYPNIRYHVSSGNSIYVTEQLDKGLIDFGLLFGAVDASKYSFIKLPVKDTWGVLMRRDSALAKLEEIGPEDLWDKPLILSQQESGSGALSTWFKRELSLLKVVSTYNLVFNASLLVEEGLGYAVVFDKIIHTAEDSPLCFKPLKPKLEDEMSLVWKKYQIFSKAAETFLNQLRVTVAL